MNFPQKRQINVAVASKRKHDLSHYHVGTTDFGRIKPIECRYLVPGDEVKINVTNETRVLNAMPSPTIGRFDVVYRSFFVPIAHVWRPFYDFLKNQPSVINGNQINVNRAPFVYLQSLITYFVTPDESWETEDLPDGHILCNEYLDVVDFPDSEAEYDFAINLENQNVRYFAWRKKGRVINDFLTSLGINIPWGTNFADESTFIRLYIVLPLVCFWKFYFDWIVPSRFIRLHTDYIQYFIDNISTNTAEISIADFVKYCLHEPLCYFLDDVFTTSTEFPFQSEQPLSNNISIANPSESIDGAYVPNQGSEYISGSATNVQDGSFNMYTLQTLGKLQDLLNRGMLAGSKVQDWLLSEFGIKPNNDALHLSTYLGSKRTTLSVADVLSNADTLSADGKTGTPLGAYAGYVNNKQQFDFGYKAQEHGFYFITYEIVPKTNYYQGLHAQFDMGDRFDFFQPEFDNQQGAPIPFRRLYFANKRPSQLSRFDNKFGFTLQYADQKFANDVISGDMSTRFGLSLKSWFLGRDMSYIAESANNIDGIDEEFCLVKSKYQNWHYIFSDMTDELDPFLVAFYFNEPAMRPMKSITEGFEPTYKNSNKEVTLDFSGSVK